MTVHLNEIARNDAGWGGVPDVRKALGAAPLFIQFLAGGRLRRWSLPVAIIRRFSLGIAKPFAPQSLNIAVQPAHPRRR